MGAVANFDLAFLLSFRLREKKNSLNGTSAHHTQRIFFGIHWCYSQERHMSADNRIKSRAASNRSPTSPAFMGGSPVNK